MSRPLLQQGLLLLQQESLPQQGVRFLQQALLRQALLQQGLLPPPRILLQFLLR